MKELLNCSKNIKTPFIQFRLKNKDENTDTFKEVLISTFLTSSELYFDGSAIQHIPWVKRFQYCYLNLETVKMNYDKKNWIHFVFDKELCTVSMFDIREELLRCLPGIIIICTHSSDKTAELYILLAEWEEVWTAEEHKFNIDALMNIHISGVLNAHEVIKNKEHCIIPEILLTNDTINDLKDVCLESLHSNCVVNTFEIFGIEAARTLLYREMKGVLGFDGAYVNPRHISVICDSITRLGYLRPMSRHGLFKDKRSALSNASFEMCTSTLNSYAVNRNVDKLSGTTEQLILGKNMTFGTGMMDLFLDVAKLEDSNVTENNEDFAKTTQENPEIYNELSPTISPMNNVDYSPCNAEFSPLSTTLLYTPTTPAYIPASPRYVPDSLSYKSDYTEEQSEKPSNDWIDQDLLEEAFG